MLEAAGLRLPVGSDCLIELPAGQFSANSGAPRTAEAEVAGFGADRRCTCCRNRTWSACRPVRASTRLSHRRSLKA
ncbi:hypothetical protein ACTMU2_26230 [Cupriavidus basilensis]